MTATVGHNSDVVRPTQLKELVERIENLLEEAAAVKEGVKEILEEAKGVGYTPKIIRRVVKLRAMDKAKRQEEEALLAVYCKALGLE